MSLMFPRPQSGHRAYRLHKAGILALAMVLAGCAPDMSDLEEYVETTRNKYEGSVEPLPQFEPYQNYVYDAFDERPPFTEPTTGQALEQENVGDNGLRPDTDRRKEPLEYFPMDSLEMVGTLERDGEMWALIKDPDDTIHRVQPGDHAGQNFGEIVGISETRVDFLEIIPDGQGAWVEREIALELGGDE